MDVLGYMHTSVVHHERTHKQQTQQSSTNKVDLYKELMRNVWGYFFCTGNLRGLCVLSNLVIWLCEPFVCYMQCIYTHRWYVGGRFCVMSSWLSGLTGHSALTKCWSTLHCWATFWLLAYACVSLLLNETDIWSWYCCRMRAAPLLAACCLCFCFGFWLRSLRLAMPGLLRLLRRCVELSLPLAFCYQYRSCSASVMYSKVLRS